MIEKLDQRKRIYILLISSLILLLSILSAYNSPAKSYELSIYSSTPDTYWIGIASVLFFTLIISLTTDDKPTLIGSLVIASMAIISIVSLPLIRSYYYFGMADSISHLGFAIRIFEGNANPIESFYPAIHTLGVSISFVTGVHLRYSLMFLLPLFALIFVFFVPLTLRTIHKKFDRKLIVIGTFSALFFMPINLISTSFHPHPSSQAVLFLPAVIYLYFEYERINDYRLLILYSVLFIGLLLLHPQQALGVFLLLFLIVILDKLTRNSFDFSFKIPILSGLIFWIWSGGREIFESATEPFLTRLFYGYTVEKGDIAQRGTSLAEIGGSIEEIFLKIFGLTVLYILFTFVFIIRRKRTISDKRKLIIYLFLGVFPISVIAGFYMIFGSGAGQTQRYVGFIQVIFTIIGAYSFFYLVKYFEPKQKSTKKTIIYIFISVGLILSGLTIFSSPYMYQGTPHVTEMHYEGYNTAFSNFNDSLELASPRMHSDRYYATTQGLTRTSELRRNFLSAPDHFNNQSLHQHYEKNTYLAVTESEITRDAELYQGFRFSYDDFEYLNRDPNINKIQTNGDFELYYVNVET